MRNSTKPAANSSKNPRLILASTSAYRRELLERLCISFEVISPKVDETPLTGESTLELALRLAQAKAAAVAKQNPHAWVIGSDQVADLCGAAIGKPGNFERAMAQLQLMRGQTVTFHTALCLMQGAVQTTLSIPTEVSFRKLSDEVIERYLLGRSLMTVRVALSQKDWALVSWSQSRVMIPLHSLVCHSLR